MSSSYFNHFGYVYSGQGGEGPQGPAGPTGAPGRDGTLSFTGSVIYVYTGASEGATGPTGTQGLMGLQGPTGAQGLMGLQGPTGAQGIAGTGSSFAHVSETGTTLTINENVNILYNSTNALTVSNTAGSYKLSYNTTNGNLSIPNIMNANLYGCTSFSPNGYALVNNGSSIVQSSTPASKLTYLNNVTSDIQAQINSITGSIGPTGAKGATGAVGPTGASPNLLAVTSNILPATNDSYNIGSTGLFWKNSFITQGYYYNVFPPYDCVGNLGGTSYRWGSIFSNSHWLRPQQDAPYVLYIQHSDGRDIMRVDTLTPQILFNADLIPFTTNTTSLGSSSSYFNNAYINNVSTNSLTSSAVSTTTLSATTLSATTILTPSITTVSNTGSYIIQSNDTTLPVTYFKINGYSSPNGASINFPSAHPLNVNSNQMTIQPTNDGSKVFQVVTASGGQLFQVNSASSYVYAQKLLLSGQGSFYSSNVILQSPNNSSMLALGYSWMTYSSANYKENIEPMTGCLGSVLQLEPVSYTWKEGYGDNIPSMTGITPIIHQGFIAQDVQKILPNVVSLDDNGEGGVDYSRLVVWAIGAIQEQNALIQSQAAMIQNLQTQYASMSTRLAILESK